ncbi:hypothetical protein BaRGS_00026521 [Batillaria attramentaria]|uniref:Uncharacterized protein n=1 Tax=Batillaria attramentaria TaxID=370345 RepID=A0ABD0K5X9_9CAEN
MAEGDATGLDILIRQRKSRPSFARMISWEIEKSSSNPPKSKTNTSASQRAKNQKRSGEQSVLESGAWEGGEEDDGDGLDDELELSESDDSEYFSAEENVHSTGYPCDGDLIDDFVGSGGEDDNSFDTNMILVSSQIGNVSLNSGDRRRAPSKKQKKKRRQHQEHYSDFTAPFRNVENFDFSIEELRGDLLSKTSDLMAGVPSLFELCLKTLRASSRQSSIGYELLPGPMKHAVSSWRQQRAFTTMQLSCLYRFLAMLERKQVDTNIDWLVMRNVWSVGHRTRDTAEQDGVGLIGSEMTMVIPYAYASCGYGKRIRYTWCGLDAQYGLYVTSLLVSVLDLMVPVTKQLVHKKGKQQLTGEDNDVAMAVSVAAALNQLKKRYPDQVELVKDRALPYLYWLRGHNKLALHEFLRLVDTESSLQWKVAYMYEAARLCRMQDQTDSARKLFRQAHDLLLDSPAARSSDAVKGELTAQMLMMCANSYDQGLLSEQKAKESLQAWRLLTTMSPPAERVESLLPVVESILCFHLTHLPGRTVKEKLKGVVGVLETVAKQCWQACLHLSLVYAWLGQQTESVKAYRGTSATSPGLEFKPDYVSDFVFTPWQLILNAATTTGREPPHPLEVVWRTQLGHFRLVRDVRLVMPSTPGLTYVNKAPLNRRFHDGEKWCEIPNGSPAVTATEMYSDSEGRSVHMLASGGAGVLDIEGSAVHVQWTNGQGQRCKLSILHLLKDPVKKHIEQRIATVYNRNEQRSRALKGLEYCYSHNLLMTEHDSYQVGDTLESIEKARESKAKSYKPVRINRRLRFVRSDPKKQLGSFRSFKCVVTDFFFDVTSKETFQSPVVRLETGENTARLKHAVGQLNKRVMRAEVLCCFFNERWRPEIFGPHGRVQETALALDSATHSDSYCVLGTSIYIVKDPAKVQGDEASTLIEVQCVEEESVVEHHQLDLNLCKVMAVADKLLLVCSDGLRVLCPQTMELQPLLRGPDSDCQLPLSEDNMALLVEAKKVAVVGEKTMTSPAGLPTVFVPVAINNYLLVLGVQERNAVADPIVEIAFCVMIAGHPTEVCFIGQTVGYLVSTTMHAQTDLFYRETVYHLSPAGHLLGVLPFLGPGPREFFPVLLPPARGSESEDTPGASEAASWHVYMRDGHEGIIAVKL